MTKTRNHGAQKTVALPALLKRINRRLWREKETVRTLRRQSWRKDIGDFYMSQLSRATVDAEHAYIEALMRSLGVLRPVERLSG